MHQRVVSLTPASPDEHRRALDEVSDFALTDMGRGGPARWTYRVLSEPHLSSELRRLAHPYSAHCLSGVTFQPNPVHELRNQDRSRIEHWPLHGGTWAFTAIFDGHVGHHTVDHAALTIPSMVKHSLDTYLRSSRGAFAPHQISDILSDAIRGFDNSISEAFMSLFPGGLGALQRMTDAQIRQIVDDRATGNGLNYLAAVRCLQGTTALLALVDPSKKHLWIANVGDCQA
ncbi:hypothetical protein EWM64_g10375, partial [Hericium alpestre]